MNQISRLCWSEVALAALLLVVLLVTFFWPAIMTGQALLPTDLIFQLDPLWQPVAPEGFTFPGNQLLFDQVYVFYPWKRFTTALSDQNHLPLWNPYSNGGQPFLANAQSALFSPFTLVSCFFPLNVSFTVTGLLPLFVAGFFTFLLAREIGISKAGALIAMMAFSFSGPMIVWLGHPLPKVAAWLPALLFVGEKLLTRQSWPYSIVMGVVIAAQFLSGHPETSFHVMVAWLAYCAYRAIALHGWRLSQLVKPGAQIASAAIAGVTASAVQLLPFLEFLRRSTILSARMNEPSPSLLATLFLDWHNWPTVITILSPRFFGTPLDGSYWYPYSNYNEQSLYAGVLPLILAVVSAIQLLKRRHSYNQERSNQPMLYFLGLAILSLGIGLRLPLFNLINRLPLLSVANNGRLRIAYVFAVAILAGFGWDQVINAVSAQSGQKEKFSLRVLALALVLVIILSLLVTTASYTGLALLKSKVIQLGRSQVEAMQGHPFYPYSLDYYYKQVDARYQKMLALFHPRHGVMYLPPMIGLGALGLCWLLVKQNKRHNLWTAVALSLIFSDLFFVGASYNPTIEPEQIYPIPRSIRFLRQDADIHRVAGLGLTLMPNSGLVYELSDVRGYDAITPKRYMDLFDRIEDSIRITHFWLLKTAKSSLLDLLNVKYVLTNQELDDKWKLVYQEDQGIRVYENRNVMPRAFVVHQAEYVDSAEESLARLTDGEFDYRTAVILEGEPIDRLSPSNGRRATFEEADIVRYEPEQVKVTAHTTADGFLVLTDGYDPGWRAELDGQPVKIYVANHAFRAVALPAGEHQVTFAYDPPAFKIGLGISLVAFWGIVVAAVGLILAHRHRTL